jgi:hypothetical protein
MTEVKPSRHESLIRALVDHLIENRFKIVKVDLPGYPNPSLLYWSTTRKGFVPDVTAEHKHSKFIFEIETEETIFDPLSEERWRLFYTNSRQYKKTFCIVVPQGYDDEAREQLANLKIKAEIWTF